MIQFVLSHIILVIVFFTSDQNEHSILNDDQNLTDSLKIEKLLDEVWQKRSNDPLAAIRIGKQAELLADEIDNKSLQAKAYNFLGVVYTNIGANEIANDYHLDALKKSKEAGDKSQEAYSYNNLGGIGKINKEFVPASESILTAIKIFEELKDTTGIAYCYVNMGRLYKSQGNYDKSLEYLNNALDLSQQVRNEELNSRILIEIPEILVEKKQYEQAEKVYNQLKKLYKKQNYLKGLAEVWNGLSELHLILRKYSDALQYSNQSLEINRKILNETGEVRNLIKVSQIYLAKNNISAARNYLERSLKKAEEINDPDLIISAYKTYYEFFKRTGQPNLSLSYYEKYNRLKDSVYTNEEMIKFNELESLIRIEKTERENLLLQRDLQQQIIQRNYLIIFSILIIIIAIIVTYRFYEKKKLSEQLKRSNLVKDKFFSIIAHDLREPYNAIFSAVELLKNNYYNISEEERKEIIDSLGRLVKTDFDLLENLLVWAQHQTDFIEFSPVEINLRNAIDKNISLFENNIKWKSISIEINCPDDVKIYADEQMLNSILRNLIFNAVKFSNKGGNIKISVLKNEDGIQFKVEDNGTGMNEETLKNLFHAENKKSMKGTSGESGTGLGLLLTKEFIGRHKGSIKVESKLGTGSTFIISIPQS